MARDRFVSSTIAVGCSDAGLVSAISPSAAPFSVGLLVSFVRTSLQVLMIA